VKKKLHKELTKEELLSIISEKYGPFIEQKCEEGKTLPVTKEFYLNYQINSEDVF